MNQSCVNQTLLKKAYQQPQLKSYGDLRRLTQGGSASKGEPVSGGSKKKL